MMDLHNRTESSSLPFALQNFVPSLTANNEVEDDRNSQPENSPRKEFWKKRRIEIDNASDIRSHPPFPLARIRRIAKSNEKVERISADATILLAKACEFFVMDLTSQAWFNKLEKDRMSLQHWDIGRALNRNTTPTNFLAHILCVESQKEAMRHLKDTMLRPAYQLSMHRPAYPLQLQNMNPPDELNLFKETDPGLGNPIHPLHMKLAFFLGNQEFPQLFSPSTSSVPLNYHPGSQEESSEKG